jgi:hypothetical protein
VEGVDQEGAEGVERLGGQHGVDDRGE